MLRLRSASNTGSYTGMPFIRRYENESTPAASALWKSAERQGDTTVTWWPRSAR